MSVVIRKCFDDVPRTIHPRSVDVEKDFRLRRDIDGNCFYVEVGERNIREYINSFEAGCSLTAILERCNLMPVRDKIAYLQQKESGFAVDFSGLPSDLTDAFIAGKKLSQDNPEIIKMLNDGLSFSQILTTILKPSEAEKVVPKPVDDKKEDINNG